MISFDSSIYQKKAMIQACSDYRELADIRCVERDGKVLCELRNPKGDEELIADEFCNYVLNLSVLMGGTAD